MSEIAKPRSLSLEDLIVLNDEIAALVVAGVPLDRGLLAAGRDLPGKLGTLTTAVAVELTRGQTLVEAIESERVALPGAYRAVVSAGVRSGRLPAALESVAGFLRRLAETRREITAALIYPVVVVVVAWVVGYSVFTWMLPRMHEMLVDFSHDRSIVADWLPVVAQAWYWVAAVPVALVLVVAWIWHGSGRAALVHGPAASVLLGWVPWVGRMVRASRVATFADVLALLLEHEAPLEKSLLLAADSTGDPGLAAAARRLSARLSAGEPLDRRQLGELPIPPLLSCMIASGLRHGTLAAALRHGARTYRRRAARAADAARVFLPIVCTLVIGGLAVAIAALGLFLPYWCMLRELANNWW